MKCKECSKIIPDGFTDCPWCGAIQPQPSVGQPMQAASPKPVNSTGSDRVAGVALLLSLGFLFGCGFLAIARDKAANPFANPAYFRGEWGGVCFWAVIIVVIFAAIRNKGVHPAVKFLVVFGAGFLLGLMNLGKPTRHLTADPSSALLRQFGDDLKNPKVSNKWNAPGRALLMDLLSFNRQYISDVSKLDETAKPLYTTESFRDTATVQAMIDQLHARIAIADKYADLEPVLSKMKGYVAAVNGSETEKREYLEGFESTLPNTRASFKALKDKERGWLQASLDLYQFTLSKRGTYAVQNGNLIFKKTGDSDTFNQKLVEARTLRTEYLRTYWEVRHTQEAMAAQMGLKGTEFDPNRPR